MAQETNSTVRGPMETNGATTPVFRFRRAGTPYSTVGILVYTGSAWVGTVNLQVSDPGRNTWVTVDSFTADDYQTLSPPSDIDIRMSFTRTSGTPIGAIINNA